MGKGIYFQRKTGRCDPADCRKVQPCGQRINAYCGCPSGKRSQSKCGDPPGCLKRSDPYDPKVPGHTDHNGETDRPWKSSAGMCRVSGDSCKSEIFHGDRRWNRQREDDISGALSNYIPKDERLITIEDNAELKIQGVQNLVRLEAKMANVDGGTSITIRDLIRTALRMRPDRIVVGEVRGGEAVDMLQALICTI